VEDRAVRETERGPVSHPRIGPVAMYLNINRGNRFISLTSTATKSRGLHNYIVDHAEKAIPTRRSDSPSVTW